MATEQHRERWQPNRAGTAGRNQSGRGQVQVGVKALGSTVLVCALFLLASCGVWPENRESSDGEGDAAPRIELPAASESSLVTAPSSEAMPAREERAALDEPLEVGGDVEPPKRLRSNGAILSPHPFFARGGYTICTCIIRLAVSKTGVPGQIEIIKPGVDRLPSEVGEEILRAVASWRFEPATRNGRAVDVWYHVSLSHCPCKP